MKAATKIKMYEGYSDYNSDPKVANEIICPLEVSNEITSPTEVWN